MPHSPTLYIRTNGIITRLGLRNYYNRSTTTLSSRNLHYVKTLKRSPPSAIPSPPGIKSAYSSSSTAATPTVITDDLTSRITTSYKCHSNHPPSPLSSFTPSSTLSLLKLPTPSSTSPRHFTSQHSMSFLSRFFSSGPSPAEMSNAKAKAQKLIDDNAVIVFSKTWCSYSRQAKSKLKQLKAEHQVFELDEASDGDEIQAALAEITGQRTVPNIFINHKHIGGNSDLQRLSEENLKNLLQEAGAM